MKIESDEKQEKRKLILPSHLNVYNFLIYFRNLFLIFLLNLNIKILFRRYYLKKTCLVPKIFIYSYFN